MTLLPAVVLDGDTDEIDGVGATVPAMLSVAAGDVCPATVTVIVACPGSSGKTWVSVGRSNVIESSLQFVIVSLAPSKGAPQLVPPCARVR